MSDEIIINSKQSKDAFMAHMSKMYDEHKFLRVTVKTGKQITDLQRKSMHLYCRLLATALNDAGYDMKKLLKPEVDIPWTDVSVKEHLWRPIQKAITGKVSTTKAETKEHPYVYEVLARHMSQKFGVFVAWPCKENKDKNE